MKFPKVPSNKVNHEHYFFQGETFNISKQFDKYLTNIRLVMNTMGHEHYGIGIFMKTHLFGHMRHIKKSVRSHGNAFTSFDDHGIKCVTWLNILCPSRQPRTSTTSHSNIVNELYILKSAQR